MKKLLFVLCSFIIGLTGITDYAFSQSLVGIWDKVSGPGDPIRYNFLSNSTVVVVHAQTPSDTADYVTFAIPSSVLRGIDLGQGGVVGWRGIYQISSDSSVLQIEGYWHTGLPPTSTPTSFSTPTTYNKMTTGIEKNETEIPQSFLLLQNYPNPFNPTTVIEYTIINAGMVSLTVYNNLGQEVATLVNKEQTPGFYEVEFNAQHLTSGIYFYRLTVGSSTQTKKLMLLK